MNALFLIFAFLTLIAFGYISFLRASNRMIRQGQAFLPKLSQLNTTQLTQTSGLSGFLFILPCTAILLFWGWGAALCWLIFHHIIIESTLLQFINDKPTIRRKANKNAINYQLANEHGVIRLLQFYLYIAVSAATLYFIIGLIDLDTGFGVFLILLIAIYRFAQSISKLTQTKQSLIIFSSIILALCVSTFFGANFSGSLGLIGSDLVSSKWLQINQHSLMAIFIVYCMFNQGQTARFFTFDIAKIIGSIIIIGTLLLLISLLVFNPELDAPVRVTPSLQSDNETQNLGVLPNLFICFILFSFGLIGLKLILCINPYAINAHSISTNKSAAKPKKDSYAQLIQNTGYHEWQISRLIIIIFSFSLLLILAAAYGIGAWKTHFTHWPASFDLASLLNLSLDSILAFSSQVSEQNEILNFFKLFIIAILILSGLVILNSSHHQLQSLRNQQKPQYAKQLDKALNHSLLNHPLLSNITILLLTMWLLEYGASLLYWLSLGIAAWVIICNFVINKTIEYIHFYPSLSNSQRAGTILSFGLFMLGITAILTLFIDNIAQAKWGGAIACLALSLSLSYFWFKKLRFLFTQQKNSLKPLQ